MNDLERTKAFIAAWEARDLDAICGMCAEGLFYHNVPMEPVEGVAALRTFAEPFLAMSEKVVWDTHHIADSGSGAVLTERVDHFHFAGGHVLSIRVMGTFEWNDDGKLQKWRDYFDLAEFQSQMPGAG